MSDLWVVLLNNGADIIPYGPMEAVEARAFAAFMTDTVDPATLRKLHSPTTEMLAWYHSERVRNNCTHGADCEVHPDTNGVHNLDEAASR